MKQTILAAVLAAFSFTTYANDVSVDGNVGITNNYLWRGVTQSDRDPAVQGGVTVGYKGFDIGFWGSNVDFNDGDEASLELDLTAGYTLSLSDRTGIRFGGIYYAYPGANDNLDYDFYEFNLGGHHQFDVWGKPIISLGTSYTPEFFGNTGKAWYHEGGLVLNIHRGLYIDGHVGYSDFDEKDMEDYWDYSVGVGYDFGNGIDVRGAYVTTSGIDGSTSSLGNEDQWVASFTYSF